MLLEKKRVVEHTQGRPGKARCGTLAERHKSPREKQLSGELQLAEKASMSRSPEILGLRLRGGASNKGQYNAHPLSHAARQKNEKSHWWIRG
jgi:hypothetical protein